MSYYETERALSEYLLLHFGAPERLLPYNFGPAGALDFPVRCVTECLDVARLPVKARALDLGCAIGRSSFELARHCWEIRGIDYSHRLITAASHLQEHGTLDFCYPEEGDLTLSSRAVVPAEIDRKRVTFETGDAEDLPPGLGSFDVVLMANLVDRLSEPRRCLEILPNLVAPAGQLIITTPCTWLEEYTPRPHWLWGYEKAGRPIRTLETLKSILEPHFILSQTRDLPFLIREHARKFQWSVALATVWLRKER